MLLRRGGTGEHFIQVEPVSNKDVNADHCTSWRATFLQQHADKQKRLASQSLVN